ncbi:hypothetical protein D9758_003430 [Tetrapyrgos nigripes]|uniref:F-box domain-containing protein n=1 Tax=Tetrapyrgos nigripes TaxID=182062 RepID=A0A8H5GUM2_9AGAR|nr:hypothetical protein D9758_003430 [Tetrapyrgos nigripes]
MTEFIDLPVELLPVILSFIPNPRSLTHTCLVNKVFYQFAVPRLYERISIYSWQKHGKERVIQLFICLSENPHVATYVRRLEIRDFPKSLPTVDGNTLDPTDIIVRALKNCTHLRSCTWTRDGSLNSEILQGLKEHSKELEELEINGHNEGNYGANVLLGFEGLRKVGLIMPGAEVVRNLSPWFGQIGSSLRHLTLICKLSSLITDTLLERLAPDMRHLDYFYLTGCPKVTERGITSVLSQNETGIVGLGLEGLSPKFNMAEFRSSCEHYSFFKRLRTLTLTIHQQVPLDEWTRQVISILSPAPSDCGSIPVPVLNLPPIPLESFQIYSTGAFFESSSITNQFWFNLVDAHHGWLKRISVHRMLISLEAIEEICRRCRELEELFVVVEPGTLHQLASRCLSIAPKLRTVHVNYPLEAQASSPTQSQSQTDADRHPTVADEDTDTIDSEFLPVLSPQDALAVVQRCPPTLTQFGCNTRVWMINKQVEINEQGNPVGIRRELARYDSPDIPEAFLVVRT